tara:strand:+ start:286 stop:492 length:207 start_codon:yes stop_codon:yes gene_type:complete
MAELVLKVDGKNKTFDTKDFNDKQKFAYSEAAVCEREVKRYKYLVAIIEERKIGLLQQIVDLADEKET